MPLRLPSGDPVLSGGLGDSQSKPGIELTISFDQVNSFAFTSCADCHHGNESPALFAYNDYRQNLDAVFKSVVVERTMPRRQKLTEEQVALVRQWIEQGAPQFIPNQPVAPEPPSTTSTTIPVVSPPAGISFEQVLKTSFQSCTKCHSAGDEDPRLETYADYKQNIVDVESTVVIKRSMPKKQKLSAEQIQLVADWIALGAPEN